MGFVMPHITVLIAGGAIGLALLLQIIGLATPAWIVTTGSETGLWKHCSQDKCSSITETTGKQDAARAFGILAVLAMASSAACVALICFMNQMKIFGLIAPIASAVGAFLAMTLFAVFANAYAKQSEYFGYSFALTIVAFLLCGVATILLFVGRSKATQ